MTSAGMVAVFWGENAGADDYQTANVERTSIAVTVSATGTLQALTTVQVGSQASGTVSWLGADFNSAVTRGQEIARLDPSTFQAQVETANANVANAEAAVLAAKAEIANQTANVQGAKASLEVARVQSRDAEALTARYREISSVIPSRDLEAAVAQSGVAKARMDQASAQLVQAEAVRKSADAKLQQSIAQLAQSKAQLEQAKVNLSRTVITSPIDGVVVSRSVDVGQTVAASLQAPTLFTIANDLRQMQALASIDEADVGQIKEGVRAQFSVDAFPGESFHGTVSQLRLNSQAVQNVVTYTAVIDVANPELKLRPGMTTNITFPVRERNDVLAIPNAALRFKLELTSEQQRKEDELLRGRESQNRSVKRSSADSSASHTSNTTTTTSPATPAVKSQIVWVLTDGTNISPRLISTGLTNGRLTEVNSGELVEGDRVVVGKVVQSTGVQQPTTSPLTPQRPNFRGRGRTR